MLLAAAAAARMQLLVLLLVTLAAAPAAGASVPDTNMSSTVVVNGPTSRPVILQSLFDPAIKAVVFSIPEFAVSPDAWTYISLDTPYVMNTASFTLLSDLNPPTVLDWHFLTEKVVMRPGNTFDMNNLVSLNTRKLSTLTIDVFINSPGAVLQVHNSILIDPVCNATTAAEDLAAAQAMPQLPQRPRNRVSAVAPHCVQLPGGSECFEQGVYMQELAVVMASTSRSSRDLATTPAKAAAAVAAGNFVIQFRNSTRVCRKYLDTQCLQENGGNRELCWQQAAGTAAGRGAGQSAGQGASPGAIAGAAIGGVAGLLAVLAAVLLYLRSRRRKRKHACPAKSADASGSSLLDGAADHSTVGELQSPGRGSQQDASGRGLRHAHAAGTAGDHGVRASFGRDGLQLGALLGFGSYGRVFQGRWHGKDVAIKIIHCQPEQLPRVLREAEIMLQLDHPNVVRALNCVVQHTPHSKPGDAQPGSSSTGTSSQLAQAARQLGSGGGGSSSDSSRKHNAGSGVSQILPVLNKDGSAGSGGSSSKVQADRRASSSSGAVERPDSAAAAADQLQTGAGGQHPRPQQELQVVPVLATGTPASSASPHRPFQEQQQQQLEKQQREKQQQEDSSPVAEGDEGFEPQVAEVWLVLELCSGGNLQDSFRQRNDAFNMLRLLCRLAEVAQGMAYLYSKNICHGDLKAANVLLANSIHGSFGQIAKLTDFGFAGVLREGVTHHSTQNLGTISHCAPEVLQSGHMSPAADVYAFAILMWELLTASTAFKGVHAGTVIQRVVLGGARPPVPPDAPEDYALLMEACWAANPADRPSFDQVLQCLTIMLASLETVNTNASNAMGDVLQQQQQQQQQRMGDTPGDPVGAAAAAGAGDVDVVVGTGAGAADSGGAPSPVQQQQQGQQQRLVGSSRLGSFDMCRMPSSSSQGVYVTSSSGVGHHSSTAAPGTSRMHVAAAASGDVAAAVGSPTTAGSSGGAFGAPRRVAVESVLLPPLTDAAAVAPGSAGGGAGSGGSSSSTQRALAGNSLLAAGRRGPVAGGGVVLQGSGLPGSAGSACSAASAGSSKLSELQLPQQSQHIQDL